MKTLLGIVLFAAFAAQAQHQHGPAQPYRDDQSREIKALSAEDVAQYRAGAGMGFAKPAELNRFPGPMHVLEFADKLGLEERQRVAMQRLMHAHKAEARAIGSKLVAAEEALEALFRSGAVETPALSRAVREAGTLHAEYRLSHLETHRQARLLLTDAQVERYQVLRGYQTAQATPDHTLHHALADGEVRKVDKDAQKITIRHGPLPALDMPLPMTMVYRVADPALLDKVKAGDKVKFEAVNEKGAFVLKRVERAP
jgi:Cu/Ag efflux protein CusF